MQNKEERQQEAPAPLMVPRVCPLPLDDAQDVSRGPPSALLRSGEPGSLRWDSVSFWDDGDTTPHAESFAPSMFHGCPSETTSASMRYSRVTWKRQQTRTRLQDWSKSKPYSFHRDERVFLNLPKEEVVQRSGSHSRENGLGSETQNTVTAASSDRMRGSTASDIKPAPLTRSHLERHVRGSGVAPPGPVNETPRTSSVAEWKPYLASSVRRNISEAFGTPQSGGGCGDNTARCSTAASAQRFGAPPQTKRSLQGAASTKSQTVDSEESADEEEEFVARFYAEQHALRRQSQNHPNGADTPLPSTVTAEGIHHDEPSQKTRIPDHTLPQTTLGASHETHIPYTGGEDPIKPDSTLQSKKSPTPITLEQTDKPVSCTTLEEFRQYIIQGKARKLERKNETTTIATVTEEQHIQPCHITNTTSNGLHGNNLTAEESIPLEQRPWNNSMATVEKNVEEYNNITAAAQQGEELLVCALALGEEERQGRGAIAGQEEANRISMLSAAQQGEELLVCALALGEEEQQGRGAIAGQEEANRVGMLSAAHQVGWSSCSFPVSGPVVGSYVGVLEDSNALAAWPSSCGVGGSNSNGSALQDGSLAFDDVESTVVKGGVYEALVGESAVGSANAVVGDVAPAPGTVDRPTYDISALAVEEGHLSVVAGDIGEGSIADASETSVAVDAVVDTPVHPMLCSPGGRLTTLPHGDPLGPDLDEEMELSPMYTWWSCLMRPFACCGGRAQRYYLSERPEDV
ncbi:hypothetical protein DQ04_02971040 [Trypanosoma grayi]|uniref:hypothetical protein n=1 Tax=Trypanosoma grayi TaxID=71804 RepID=UPI0004F4980E|nr:hypothetical protein DQ04_02971040 [Trypanosoma grayi]KEG11110.1 hypothetical protein DQ04_02971040 [Trypanosoma grayi]